MKTLVCLIAVAALAGPIAASADGTPAPTPASTANHICKLAQTSMGTLFGQTYATFGKCVSKNTAAGTQDVNNAAKTCKAQQADPNFAATHDGNTFDQYYGGNASKGKGADANAYGKCVSKTVSAAAGAQAAALTKAAKTCRAARAASTAAFATAWGTGRSAFGKCVAATTK
jgi:hypothetical protein